MLFLQTTVKKLFIHIKLCITRALWDWILNGCGPVPKDTRTSPYLATNSYPARATVTHHHDPWNHPPSGAIPTLVPVWRDSGLGKLGNLFHKTTQLNEKHCDSSPGLFVTQTLPVCAILASLSTTSHVSHFAVVRQTHTAVCFLCSSLFLPESKRVG